MSFDSMQPRRQVSSDREAWARRSSALDGPPASKAPRFWAALLMLLAVTLLCVVSFLVYRVLFSDSRPAALPAYVTRTGSLPTASPDQPTTGTAAAPETNRITANPGQGYINTLVTVTGEGWWPGEPVFVFLRSQQEGDGPGFAYAAAVADDQGRIHTAFTFPNEMRWIGEEWADVIARGTRSGLEAITRFALVAPSPTHTAPIPTTAPTLMITNTPRPTDTPLPAASPTPDIIIRDWRGEYFSNPGLAGEPVYIRNDVAIDFNWGGGSPDPRIPDDGFSARWTRQLHFSDGYYRFTILSDDGVRFWIDGHLFVDEWHDSTLAPHHVDLYVPQGQHSLLLEYYENAGGAMVRLSWGSAEPPTATPTRTPTQSATPTPSPSHTPTQSVTPSPTPSPSQTPTPTLTPTSEPSETPTLTPTPSETPSSTPEPTDTAVPTTEPPARSLPASWRAEFYANPSLVEPVALSRDDAVLSFDWGGGSPGQGIPADHFSARWLGEVWLPGGVYVYSLSVDDGVRFWVDGQSVVDAWHPTGGTTHTVNLDLLEGKHAFQVEYLEATDRAHIHLSGQMADNSFSGTFLPGS